MEYTSKEVYEYVSKHANDPILEWKKCRISWQDFPIYKSDLEFYDKISPTFEVSEEYAKEFLERNNDVKDSFEYKDWKLKAKLPTPTLCPEEREAQRFVFRNENHLYRWKCAYSWKDIITTISPDKDYVVYDEKFRWEDKREPKKIDQVKFDKSFFHIMNEILHNTPVRWKFVQRNENSDYVNITWNSKNCYMCFASYDLNDCYYVQDWTYSNNCVDCLFADYCEYCYDCVKINHCYGLFHCDNCINCSNSSYLYNCTGCHDCFNCSNLDNQSYCINNKQYTQEEYARLLPTLKPNVIEKSLLWCSINNSDNCFWNNIVNCHNCYFIWTWTECSDIKYTSYEIQSEDCIDSFCNSKHCIYTVSCRVSYNCWYIFYGDNLNNCRYCWNCNDCNSCFWCNWLRKKEFHIYNKQYTKEEYNKIVPQIIAQMIRDKEWWEFFDPQLSYFGYNESMAMDYHPLTKEEALMRWYKWSDYESPMPHVEKNVNWVDLPKQWCKIIREKKPEILEKILNYAIICEVSKRPFRITKQEIDFYVKHNLPLPTKHPDIRHKERFERNDPTIMKLINCDNCWEEMLSVHEKWGWRRILCEKCFYKNM